MIGSLLLIARCGCSCRARSSSTSAVPPAPCAARTSGPPPTGSLPTLRKPSLTSGSASAALTLLFSSSTAALGVPAGANRPNQTEASKPGTADFGNRRLVRMQRRSLGGGDAEQPHRAAADIAERRRDAVEGELDAAADQVGHHRRRAPVGDVVGLDAGHRVEQLGDQMIAAAGAVGAERQLAGLGLGERDQLGGVLHRHVVVGDQHQRRRRDQRDRREVAHRIVGAAWRRRSGWCRACWRCRAAACSRRAAPARRRWRRASRRRRRDSR